MRQPAIDVPRHAPRIAPQGPRHLQMAVHFGAEAVHRGDGLPRNAAEGANPGPDAHSPVINLRNRRILEVLDAALSLRSAPVRAERETALALLERRVGELPVSFLEKAAEEEPDAALRAAIQSAAQSALAGIVILVIFALPNGLTDLFLRRGQGGGDGGGLGRFLRLPGTERQR